MTSRSSAAAAAAIAKDLSTDPSNLPPDALRGALREQHVQLEHPMPDELRRRLLNE